MTTKIAVASISSARELEAGMAAREKKIAKAEAFVRENFGDGILRFMTDLREKAGGRPSIVFARQIAKPELRHAALYKMAEAMNYNLVTLEWVNDFLSMDADGYKRYCVDVPMGYLGNKGILVARHTNLIRGTPVSLVPNCKVRMDEIEIPARNTKALRDSLAKGICSELASLFEERSYALQELHSLLRNGIEGTDQIVMDAGILGELAAAGGPTNASQPEGELMYLLLFALHNVIPNTVLAESDWNKDCEKLRRRYEIAVSMLESRGLDAPMQFIMPSLHESLKEPMGGTSVQLDRVVPARKGICEVAKAERHDDLGRTFTEAAKSIVAALRVPSV